MAKQPNRVQKKDGMLAPAGKLKLKSQVIRESESEISLIALNENGG